MLQLLKDQVESMYNTRTTNTVFKYLRKSELTACYNLEREREREK